MSELKSNMNATNFKVIWKIYKSRLKKNILQSSSIFITLYFILGILDNLSSKNYKFIILEIFVSLIVPFGEIIDIVYNKQRKIILSKIYNLEFVVSRALKENNQQKINSISQRLDTEYNIIKDISKGQISLASLQNYEYVRNVLIRILNQIMMRNDQYITLSSLDFWTKEPFLAGGGRTGFIQSNAKAVGNEGNKHVKRIIVIDKRLILSNEKINALSNVDESVKNILVSDRKILTLLVEDFKKSSLGNHNSYKSPFLTLFCVVDSKQLELHRSYLASVLILSSNFKNLMFIKTEDLKKIPSKNAKINIAFHNLPKGIIINETFNYDIKGIINRLCHNAEKILKNETITQEPFTLNIEEFLSIYDLYFGKIHCDVDNFIIDNKELITINKMSQILNN